MALKKAKNYITRKSKEDNSESKTDLEDKIENEKITNNDMGNLPIRIDKINRNIDTEQYSSVLKYDFKGHEHTLEVKRTRYLGRREIIKLQDFGLDVTEYNADKIIKHLQHEEKGAPITWVHSRVGFDIFEGKYVFKHYGGINVPSSYNGDLDIIPKGIYGEWYTTVINYVIKNIPLETALVIGFSSAIVGLLSLVSNYDSLLVHLSGDSTTGKTTASMLAISVWGNPNTKITNGLATTWNTTENAMFTNIIGNHGLAVLFDEVSMNDSLDFTKFIYKFTGNKDKGRLNKESKPDDTGTWGSTFISNGEFSLLEKSKKNTGAQLRILDFYNVTWTKDAESADSIQQSILGNYGHAGVEFVRKLFESNLLEEIYEEIKNERGCVLKSMKEEGLEDKYMARRSWKYAILMYTARVVKELLSIPIHIHEIWDFLMENEKQSMNTRSLHKNAFEYFLEQVNINYKKFLSSHSLEATCDADVKNPNDIMGKINVLANKDYNEICIYPNLFRKIMKDGGFEDPKIILKSWKDQGILDAEVDRYTRKRKMIENGGAIPVHIIRVNKDELSVEGSNENLQ